LDEILNNVLEAKWAKGLLMGMAGSVAVRALRGDSVAPVASARLLLLIPLFVLPAIILAPALGAPP